MCKIEISQRYLGRLKVGNNVSYKGSGEEFQVDAAEILWNFVLCNLLTWAKLLNFLGHWTFDFGECLKASELGEILLTVSLSLWGH